MCWNFHFFTEISDFDRNFCQLNQLKQYSFLRFFQFSGGTTYARRNFGEAKLRKCGQLSLICPK